VSSRDVPTSSGEDATCIVMPARCIVARLTTSVNLPSLTALRGGGYKTGHGKVYAGERISS
jgi:hypothetical protein